MKHIPVIISLFLLSCTTVKQLETNQQPVISKIKLDRIEKDKSFKFDNDSPIPDVDKTEFHRLEYFPIDLNYSFRLPIQKIQNAKPFDMATSSGKIRKAIKFGTINFKVDDKQCILSVYKLLALNKSHPKLLFIPFSDKTNGKESYILGRYIELQENESGMYDIDFNLAYNPSCAYGKTIYNCPIPPTDNSLNCSIKAGEKAYKSHQ